MGGNFDYRKLRKEYKKNEVMILLHGLVTQRQKMEWSLKRLMKINPNARDIIKQYKKGINKSIDNIINH